MSGNNWPFVVNGNTYNETDFDPFGYITALKLQSSLGDMVLQMLLLHTGTSTTSNTIGTGAKSFTTQANLAFRAGDQIVVANTAAPQTNRMIGTVTSYNIATGAMVVNVYLVYGSGTFTAWQLARNGVASALSGDVILALDQGGFGSGRSSLVLPAAFLGLADPSCAMAEIYEDFLGSQGDATAGANAGTFEPPWYSYNNNHSVDVSADPTTPTSNNFGYAFLGCNNVLSTNAYSGFLFYGSNGFMHVGRGAVVFETNLYGVNQSGGYAMAAGLRPNGSNLLSNMFNGGGIGFRAQTGINGGRYQCLAGANSIVKTLNTGVTPNALNDRLRFEVDHDGRIVDFFINGLYVGQVIDNLPTDNNNNLLTLGFESQMYKNGVNYTTTGFYIDSVQLRKFVLR